MENTNESKYGRKVVRGQARKQASRNFAIFTLSVLLIGIVIGCLGWSVTHRQEAQVAVPDENERILEYIRDYGAYDDRVLTQEISMDWGADDDFIPLDVSLDADTQEFVFYLCKGYNLDWTLVMAIMQKESNFKVNAVSKTGDYGLMQINQCNHEWLTETIGVTDYLDSEENIRAGCFVLRKLFESYTDPNMVLMAYNMGTRGATRLWNQGIYESSYSQDVLRIQKTFIDQLEERTGE